MRVLITVPDLALDSGGPSLSSTRTADHLQALGIETTIACAATRAPELLPSHPAVQILRVPKGHLFTYRQALLESPHARHAGLVYDFGVWTPQNIASAWVARRLGVPWVISPRGMLEPWALSSKRLKKKLAWTLYQRAMMRGAAALIATSAAEECNLRTLLPDARIVCVPNGVELPALPARRRRTARQAVYLSRLDPKKQPDLLIQVWDQLRPAGWRLVIAGPGDDAYRRQLRQQIETGGLTDVIDLRGPAFGADKERLLLESELFVLPTHSENFGLVIVEALAHELPVVTTTGTPWQEIADRDCGWIVEPTAEGLAAALRMACMKTPAELEMMGRRGRELARCYSWERTAASLRTLFHDLTAAA